MLYKNITDRIWANVGRENKPGTQLEDIKNDLFDVLTKLTRKVEPIKKESDQIIISNDETVLTSGILVVGRTYKINNFISGDIFTNAGASSNATGVIFVATETTPTIWINGSELLPYTKQVVVPSDFYVPLEVLFFNSDGQQYPSKELQYEEYMRWNPDVTADQTSFGQFDVTSTPTPLIYTQENFDFDGLVGYTFSDTNPQQLLWKPAINGYAKIFYAIYPTVAIAELTDSPNIHAAFHDLLVIEVTIKILVRKLKTITDQIQSFGLQAEIKHYKEERLEILKDLAGFVNRDTSTPTVTFFDFLNDHNMLILNENW